MDSVTGWTQNDLPHDESWPVCTKCIKFEKMVLVQWLQLKMKFLVGYNLCYLVRGIDLWFLEIKIWWEGIY